MPKKYNVFISHASEDKRDVALPLAQALRRAGLTVWVDTHELTLGDKLRDKINTGLAESRFGVVILSPRFFAKNWPKDELNALMALEGEAGQKILLPIRYQMTRRELVAADPLMGGRLDIAYDEDGLDRVVSAILKVTGRPLAGTSGQVVVDFSHGQERWNYLLPFFERRELGCTKITRGLQEEAEMLDGASVLVMPLPYHARLAKSEIDLMEGWVNGGKGLLFMGHYAERHHETNIRELAWRFDLDFGDDVVLPPNSIDQHARDQVYSRNTELAVKVGLPPDGHPLLAGCSRLAFLSSASIRLVRQEPSPELLVLSPEDSVVFRPLGHIEPNGYRPSIDVWTVDRTNAAVPMVIARRWGNGRLVATGTWKLCTVDYGDNFKFLRNSLTWLSAPH